MTRRSFFTKLFGAAAGVGALLVPRCYPSVDGVRSATMKAAAFSPSARWVFPYLIPMSQIDEQQKMILQQYMLAAIASPIDS